jgi:Bacterial SH3 domain
MLSRRAGGPLLVQVPGPDEDRPQWKKVAVIAAVGFVVGIVWPRLAGVRMGPSLPEASSSAAPGPTSVVQTPPAVSQVPPLPAAASLANGALLDSAQHPAPPQQSPISSVAAAPRGIVAKTSDPSSGRSALPGPSASPHSNGDAAEGTALVVWEVAIIRDAPKTGKVVARLQRGSTLRVGPVKDGWYPVRYGEGFSGDGWVYRGAIGR